MDKTMETMKCKFCKGQMTLEGEDFCCDYCGATYRSKLTIQGESESESENVWTIPVKNLHCGVCGHEISVDQLGDDDEQGAICVTCCDKIGSKPKFKLNQIIHYMRDNHVHSAPICTVSHVINSHDDGWAYTKTQQTEWQRFGPTATNYVTYHGIVNEYEAYATKEELLKSL